MSDEKTESAAQEDKPGKVYKGLLIPSDLGFSVMVPALGGTLAFAADRSEAMAKCEEYLVSLVGDPRFEVSIEPTGDPEEWTEFVVKPNVPGLLAPFDVAQRTDDILGY